VNTPRIACIHDEETLLVLYPVTDVREIVLNLAVRWHYSLHCFRVSGPGLRCSLQQIPESGAPRRIGCPSNACGWTSPLSFSDKVSDVAITLQLDARDSAFVDAALSGQHIVDIAGFDE